MPGFDRTGPLGNGPMTGRGIGPCGRGTARGFRRGTGRGLGMGFGRGFARSYAPTFEPVLTKEQEIADLRAEKEAIAEELKTIDARLKELENKKK